MSSERTAAEVKQISFRELAMLVLSIYVLVAMFVQGVLPLDPQVELLLDRLDFFICIFFLIDFGIGFHQAPSKSRFMRWGWVDLLASIPLWDAARWGRAIRIVRVFRMLRAFRSARHLFQFLFRKRTEATIVTAALAVGMLVMIASVVVLHFEHDAAGATITSAGDAFWWAVTTVTTVGYGDKVPVTAEGRSVAAVLMVAGIALFGVFTGLFARLLIGPETPAADPSMAQVLAELREIREKLERLEEREVSPPQISGIAAPDLRRGEETRAEVKIAELI